MVPALGPGPGPGGCGGGRDRIAMAMLAVNVHFSLPVCLFCLTRVIVTGMSGASLRAVGRAIIPGGAIGSRTVQAHRWSGRMVRRYLHATP